MAHDLEAARRPFHVSILRSIMVCVRSTAEWPPTFEAGLAPLLVLLDLLDTTKIPPADLPGVIKAVHELRQKYYGQGPARMTELIGNSVDFLALYQEELVENGKIKVEDAWSLPAEAVVVVS